MVDIQLKSEVLCVQDCIDFVSDDAVGGLVVFIGTVRNHTKNKRVLRLDFEAYEPMAISEMRKIAQEAVKRFDIEKVAIHHRVGSLDIGEVPVVIAISAAHRKAAFEACSFAIDTLKVKVPIWKKEFFEDGEVWVAAHP